MYLKIKNFNYLNYVRKDEIFSLHNKNNLWWEIRGWGVILIANFKKQAESIAKNNKFPNPLGSINIPWATLSSPWGSRLIAQGEFMGEK